MTAPDAEPYPIAWRIVRGYPHYTASNWRALPARALRPSDGKDARIQLAYAYPLPDPKPTRTP